MDITLDKKSNTEASIKIKLEEADYQSKIADKVKEYSKKANMKGFRPGKVPTGLIKKMYGKSILVEEVSELLGKSLENYIKENKIKIIGEPLPDAEQTKDIDWDNQKEFEFEYAIGLEDDFQYELSEKVKVDAYEIDIEDKTVEDTIEQLKQRYGTVTNPEKFEEGDSVYGELREVNGDFSTTTLITTEQIKKEALENFIGKGKDDVISLNIREVFVDDEALARASGLKEEELEQLNGDYELLVKNINRTEPAEMNQEFFDKVYGADAVKSEEEFREKITSSISENYAQQSDSFLMQTVQKKLLEDTDIELPNDFLKKWLLASNQGKVSEEEIEKDFDNYTKNLKWTLIVNKIAEDNEIKVEHEEVKDKAKDLITSQLISSGMIHYMQDNLDNFAENYLNADEGKNYMNVHHQVRSEKIFDVIKEKVTINSKKIDLEAFKALLSDS